MRSKLSAAVLSSLVCSCLGLVSVGRAADPPKAKITYQDHVSAVFRSRCGSCHNPDKQKGGLNLDNYGATLQGGGSGKVIEPGDADNSTIFLVVTHKEEPKMPPNVGEDPGRRDRADPQVDRRRRPGEFRQRRLRQGQAEVRVQARPRVIG